MQNNPNLIFVQKWVLKLEINIEAHGQCSLKSVETLKVLRCTFGPNLEFLASTGGERWVRET